MKLKSLLFWRLGNALVLAGSDFPQTWLNVLPNSEIVLEVRAFP